MTDNRKLERIPLLKISVAQKFHYDLYSRDFFLHPKDTPITENDLKAFRLWQVETLDPVDNDNTVQRVEFDTALDDSLSIMQQDIMNMHQAQELHQEICDFVTASYQTVFKQLRFHTGEPMASIKQFIEQIRRMGFSILRFQEFQTEGGYVENHAVNSFILTVALGNAAKIPQHRLINLALAAMFHEVGLVKFADLVGGGRTLSVEEFHLQKSHVQDSVDLLEAYDFAPEVMTGILQHHERLDGSGYPHGKSEIVITDSGRYLGLVCSYVAMTGDQRSREPRLAHTVILTLLKGANIHYDPDLVRILVQLLSLYPVGSYVALSNGAIGRVLQNNQKDPRLPIIQIILDTKYRFVSKSTVIETNEDIRVSQAIPYKKIAPLIERLKKTKS